MCRMVLAVVLGGLIGWNAPLPAQDALPPVPAGRDARLIGKEGNVSRQKPVRSWPPAQVDN